ncbi:hypothetical protein NA63_1819 [Flavobacteriaceae bacterium MAR_2010_105]|nr:hypothetical protein NA63_1819 [Flavobacteriaceae bacterium MAR_2010_105]
MKKLLTICLIMATTLTVNAQDAKPTKEQTVQFIKDYFSNETPLSAIKMYKDNDGQATNIYYNIDSINIQFDSTSNTMTVYYDSRNHSRILTSSGAWNSTDFSKNKFSIDLSKIELINISVEILNENKGNTALVYLAFNASSGYLINSYQINEMDPYDENKLSLNDLVLPITAKEVKSVKIPIKLYNVSDDFNHSEYNQKILKSFNHLRKLCGAPDPISFD